VIIKMRFRRAVLLTVTLSAALQTARAEVDDNVADQLKTYYLNKVVTLRHFYKGDHLSFAKDGSLVGPADTGPWTIDSQVLIKTVELRGPSLQIQGRRVCLVFDDKTKSFRDVVDWAAESKWPNWEKVRDDYLNYKNVAIEVALASENPDAQEVAAALNMILLKTGESLADFVPDFWRDYFDRVQGRPSSGIHSTETVYRVMTGGVSPPRPIVQPVAELSEEARKAGFHGIETLGVVVGASGKTTDIMIVTPLGWGLDEKAVDAIRGWRFEPAKKKDSRSR
jgi:TonB family protein